MFTQPCNHTRVVEPSSTYLKPVSAATVAGTSPEIVLALKSRYVSTDCCDRAEGMVPHRRLPCTSTRTRLDRAVMTLQSLVDSALPASDKYLQGNPTKPRTKCDQQANKACSCHDLAQRTAIA